MRIAFTALMLLGVISLHAQSTTQIEYNYLKKGIPETEEKGLDVKKGYDLIEMPEFDINNSEYKVQMRKLQRGADKSLAGISIKVTVKPGVFNNESFRYFAMPAPNTKPAESYGWEDFFSDIKTQPYTLRDMLLESWAYKISYFLTK